MKEANYEARRERREREREAGIAFQAMLRELLRVGDLRVEDLLDRDEMGESGGDDAA